ncbi:MerR family transcriptional regulator [Lihuaxuella thermophila]|uniref:DNA-binding transcriptional regulator, MerR family n=1 Tax=Lihuaxuella thermophila TaxID=1173111 RepID=A0A1H8ISI4_9BACL|nr:MerR family transcriptional regulator [Lihuaxuella thermophila]SEN70976.1 DNA-binding transcriptional regulator, MerR family [Lihuaxuella thermophila]
MAKQVWKVGEIAKQTGITVRTLRYYDQLGLLKPTEHTETGHRLYTYQDLLRLQQILSLRQLGFPLEEIKQILESGQLIPLKLVRMHRERVEAQIQEQHELYRQLANLERVLTSRQELSVEQLIHLLGAMKMTEKYFNEEQMEYLKKRREMLGEETIHSAENEWPELIAKVRAEMAKGTPPTDPTVLALAKRWHELVQMFTGGDQGIFQSLQKQYQESPDVAVQTCGDQECFRYVGEAIKHLGLKWF